MDAASLCRPGDDIAFEKINFPLRWGNRFSIDQSETTDNDWQEAGTG